MLHAVGVAILEQPAGHRGGEPELVEVQPEGAGAVGGPAEQRGEGEWGEKDQEGQMQVLMAVIVRLNNIPPTVAEVTV